MAGTYVARGGCANDDTRRSSHVTARNGGSIDKGVNSCYGFRMVLYVE